MSDLPILPHLGHDFLAWLWWRSATTGGSMTCVDGTTLTAYLDGHVTLKSHGGGRAARFKAEVLDDCTQAREMLASAYIVSAGVCVSIEGREYAFTLKGVDMSMSSIKMPTEVKGGDLAECVEQTALWDELVSALASLFETFATERTADDWQQQVKHMRAWVAGIDEGEELIPNKETAALVYAAAMDPETPLKLRRWGFDLNGQGWLFGAVRGGDAQQAPPPPRDPTSFIARCRVAHGQASHLHEADSASEWMDALEDMEKAAKAPDGVLDWERLKGIEHAITSFDGGGGDP